MLSGISSDFLGQSDSKTEAPLRCSQHHKPTSTKCEDSTPTPSRSHIADTKRQNLDPIASEIDSQLGPRLRRLSRRLRRRLVPGLLIGSTSRADRARSQYRYRRRDVSRCGRPVAVRTYISRRRPTATPTHSGIRYRQKATRDSRDCIRAGLDDPTASSHFPASRHLRHFRPRPPSTFESLARLARGAHLVVTTLLLSPWSAKAFLGVRQLILDSDSCFRRGKPASTLTARPVILRRPPCSTSAE